MFDLNHETSLGTGSLARVPPSTYSSKTKKKMYVLPIRNIYKIYLNCINLSLIIRKNAYYTHFAVIFRRGRSYTYV